MVDSMLCRYTWSAIKYFLYRSEVDHDAMAEALISEVHSLLKMSSINHVTSIYFGGGKLLPHSHDNGY